MEGSRYIVVNIDRYVNIMALYFIVNLCDFAYTLGLRFLIFRMLEADFTTGAILISFGAVLGVASPVQMLFMIILEVVFYNVSIFFVSVLRLYIYQGHMMLGFHPGDPGSIPGIVTLF